MAKNQNLAAQEEIVRIAAETAAKVTLETIRSEKRKNEMRRYDWRLRNTKLLLRNYRMLAAHASSTVYKPSQETPEEEYSAIDILDMLDEMDDYYDEPVYVESLKRSRGRTAVIINHINAMLRFYEIFCNQSPKPEDRRRYDALHAFYISEEQMSAREIARQLDIEVRVVYKDIDAAVEKLSALIFGIDGLKMVR